MNISLALKPRMNRDGKRYFVGNVLDHAVFVFPVGREGDHLLVVKPRPANAQQAADDERDYMGAWKDE